MEELLNKKDCMFQYATKSKIYEDTGLITLQEAEALWEKYFLRCKQQLMDGDEPQMCIRIDCNSETSYHKAIKEIDYRDCEVRGGSIYRIKTELEEIR